MDNIVDMLKIRPRELTPEIEYTSSSCSYSPSRSLSLIGKGL
jgi:hypothetical protein